ncbi:MAG: ATP phosphoribosyltransferase [Candidatus Pacebacteria bacterium]|nr:ATP phosphoribosyltransferase [Candidatus Paceibacterota bacterium]
MKRNNVRIAVQKDGRLRASSLKFLESLGLAIKKVDERALVAQCSNENVEILYVRHSDIPKYVLNGVADFAILGANVLYENSLELKKIKTLDFGQCSLKIAVPKESPIKNIIDLNGERIATSYPNSLCKFLQSQKIHASIIEINGSVEVTPSLGLADAICDLTQTGNTLKANGLRSIHTIFDSVALFVESPFEDSLKKKFIEKFLESK